MSALQLHSIRHIIPLIASASLEVTNLARGAQKVPDSLRHAIVVQIQQICRLSVIVEKYPALDTVQYQETLRSIYDVIVCVGNEMRILQIGDQDPLVTMKTSEKSSETPAMARNLSLDNLERHLRQLSVHKSSLIQGIRQLDPSQSGVLELDSMSVVSESTWETNERDGSFSTPNDTMSVGSDPNSRDETVLTVISTMEGKIDALAKEVAMLSKQLERLKFHAADAERSSKPIKHIFHIPNRRSTNFLGRAEVLEQLDLLLCPKDDSSNVPRIAVIKGMGGQGKSQIALHFCFEKRLKPFTTILWFDATSEDSLKSGLQMASDMLESSGVHLETNQAKEQYTMAYLASDTNPWLLVFDNFDVADYRLQDYFPQSVNGAILVTSRNAVTREIVSNDQAYVQLGGLAQDDAVDLLHRISGTSDQGTYPTSSWAVVERLGHHPLAITQAASYIRKQRIRIDQFMDHYNARRRMVLENTPALSEYRRRLSDSDQERALNVMTTTELSLQQLQRQNAGGIEMELLMTFAFLDKQNISETVFKTARDEIDGVPLSAAGRHQQKWLKGFYTEGVWDSAAYATAVQNLAEISLVQNWERQENGCIQVNVHPLIQDWLKLSNTAQTCATYTIKIWLLLGTSLKANMPQRLTDPVLSVSDQQQYIRHMQVQMQNHQLYLAPQASFLTSTGADDIQGCRYYCGLFMFRMWQHPIALSLMTSLLVYQKQRGKELGPGVSLATHEDFIGRMNGIYFHLCRGYSAIGRRDLTKHYILENMDWINSLHGGDIEHLVRLKLMLAMNAIETGDLKYAEPLLFEALHGAVRFNQDLVNEITVTLGRLYLKRGKWTKAEHYIREAIQSARSDAEADAGSGARSPEMMDFTEVLGDLFTVTKRHAEAAEEYSRVLAYRLENFGPNHPKTKRVEKSLEHVRYQLLTPINELDSTGDEESDDESALPT